MRAGSKVPDLYCVWINARLQISSPRSVRSLHKIASTGKAMRASRAGLKRLRPSDRRCWASFRQQSSASEPALAVSSSHYDLVIIGSGPAAQKCAVDSAKAGRRVAVIDKKGMLGGVCTHTGTIPSKTFREAVLHLTGYRHQGFYGRAYQPWRERISIPDLLLRVKKVETAETNVVVDQLRRDGVEILTGTARFMDTGGGADAPPKIAVLKTTQTLEADSSAYRHIEASAAKSVISADKVLIACGTRPLRPSHIPFDGHTCFDSDQLLWGGVTDVPRDLIVVGAGVIGMEYASMFNIVPGTQVTVIDPRKEILGFADTEVIQALMYTMRLRGARFLLGEKIESVNSKTGRVISHLASGKRVVGDALLYTMGRQGNTESLHLDAVGLTADARGLLEVNSYYQSTNPRIYACGDIIGYPALASTSMEQGRRAAVHMWGGGGALSGVIDKSSEFPSAEEDLSQVKNVAAGGFLGRSSESLFPYGIYTIPEISMIGKSEAQLTAEKVPYEVGVADFTELAKGQMMGGSDGFLKLIFHRETLKLLGVHAIGEGATEIIHIGQVVMSQSGSIEYFLTAVFNYPTLAEAYNVAAFNGIRKLTDRPLTTALSSS